MNNDTEMYSALAAEVEIPSDKRTLMNEQLLDQLKTYDKVCPFLPSLFFSFYFI
jgi:hypothetical protein